MGGNSGKLLKMVRKAWQLLREGVRGRYVEIVEASTRQITGKVGKFVKHRCRDEFEAEEDGLSSSCRRETVTEMSKAATKVRPLQPM